MRRRVSVAGIAAAAVLGIGLSACSSSLSSGGNPTGTPPTSTGARSGAASAGLQTAQARVAAYSKAPTSLAALGIDTPVTVGSKPITIGFDACQSSLCATIGASIKAAAAHIGAKYVVENNDGSPQSIQTAMNNLVQAKPSVVVVTGDAIQYWKKQLAEFKSMNIPIVALGQPFGFTAPSEDIAANVITGDDYYFWGVLEADYIGTQSNGNCGNVIVDGVPAYPVIKENQQGIIDELKKVCPGSKTYAQSFNVSDLGSGANVTSDVNIARKDSDVKWIASPLGATISTQLSQALKAAGISGIKAISSNDTSSNFQLIKSGNLQVAGVDFSPAFAGYRIVDAALRVLSGATLKPATAPSDSTLAGHPSIGAGGVPYTVLTSNSITDPNADTAPPFSSYASDFEALWKK